MTLLLDTHVLIWAADDSERLGRAARNAIVDTRNELVFSAASIWELTIKHMSRRSDVSVDPRRLRRMLLENDYRELPITSNHALAVESLPPIHADPFDRILVAQAAVEAATLVTSDRVLLRYPGSILFSAARS